MFLAVNNIKKIKTFDTRLSQSTAPSDDQTNKRIVTRKEKWGEFKIRKQDVISQYLK